MILKYHIIKYLFNIFNKDYLKIKRNYIFIKKYLK